MAKKFHFDIADEKIKNLFPLFFNYSSFLCREAVLCLYA